MVGKLNILNIDSDKGLRKALGRYLVVTEDKELPLFLLCDSIEAEKMESEGMLEMWKEHDKKMNELNWMKNQGLQKEDLTETDYSLLDLKIDLAEKNVESCTLCERKCSVNRKNGKVGFCGVGYHSRVANTFVHHGEEPELVPSGTIFFSGCNSRCVFCQNWDISQYPTKGDIWEPEKISDWVRKKFNNNEIINVNFVGGEPTPNTHNILKSLKLLDVNIPTVWNSNFYMSEECIKLLSGVIDVYLSDFKYGKDQCAKRLSNLPDYTRIVKRNHLLAKDQGEILIRHLVMPNHVECCSKPILKWIKENLGENVRVNIMSQYRPEFRAYEFPEIDRKITADEYKEVVKYAREIDLWNIETQPMI